jgi:hypothetical protein
MHFVVLCARSKFLVPLLVNQTPFLLCCVVDGFCPSGLEFHGVLPHVLQPPLVLLLSFSAVFGESSPPLVFVVLLMVFFLVVLSLQVLFFVFLNLP